MSKASGTVTKNPTAMSIEQDEQKAVTIINLTGEANPPTMELEQSVIGNSPAKIQRIPIQPNTSRN